MLDYSTALKAENIPPPLVTINTRMVIVRHGCQQSHWFSVYKGRKRLATIKPDHMLEIFEELWGNYFQATVRWSCSDQLDTFHIKLKPNAFGFQDLCLTVPVSGDRKYSVDVSISDIQSFTKDAISCILFNPYQETEIIGYLINNSELNITAIETLNPLELPEYRMAVDYYIGDFPESYKKARLLTHEQRVLDIFTACGL